MDPDHQASLEMVTFPQSVMFLVGTKDPWAAPVFRLGLKSRNPGVVYSSAYGLLLLGNKEDVEPVVRLAEQQSKRNQLFFAAMLSHVDKPGALAELSRVLRAGSQLEVSYRNHSYEKPAAVKK